MKTTKKTTDNKTASKIKPKEEPASSKIEDKKKVASTPRSYVQKASTADIYGQKNGQPKAPKKTPGTTKSDTSPMRNLLKSSSSSISQISTISRKEKEKSPNVYSARIKKDEKKSTPRLARDLPFSNVTVNSPGARKKLDVVDIKNKKESGKIRNVDVKSKSLVVNNVESRQRTKTRTLDESEVKVLTPDAVDNNAEMMKLSRKLVAKPKAFYVDLDDGKAQAIEKAVINKTSDEEVSYEDDFESYESDFDSYHSSHTDEGSNDDAGDGEDHNSDVHSLDEQQSQTKENEEKMLDSGNFELREPQRSANSSQPTLGFIQEDGEVDVKVSLTDEGFQEMSCSSTSSVKTRHVDVLDRPLFIDFTKAKANKRKRRIFENLKQRAKDILSMVTLHEMSYSLFEMKPIPYDLFMATFGCSNYKQTGVQTFEDGITEEVQTDEIECNTKWTQHPVEFSIHDVVLKSDGRKRKYSQNGEDYLSKFTLMMNKNMDASINNKINTDLNYKVNPLRMYFEQKDGAGDCEMLPYETYESKLKNNEFNSGRLRKFLKKFERRINNVLNSNTCNEKLTDVVKSSKYPFSNGYVTLSTKNITDEKFTLLKYAKITNIIFSDTRSNLIMTVHKKSGSLDRCVACLWDHSVAREPVKILIAIDNIVLARFRGNTDGIFVAALEDGSIHLWDLSEEATWSSDASDQKTTNLVEINTNAPLTQSERDREWNLQNSNVGYDTGPHLFPLQACSYTSSAGTLNGGPAPGVVVGLEMGWHAKSEGSQGRKVIGQVCSLHSVGILSIWLIIQDKLITQNDLGKAYWSKMKLELNQRISLIDHLNLKSEPTTTDNINFNLNLAKRRVSMRRKEKNAAKKVSRQKSAVSFDSDRPSTASGKNRRAVLPENNWENGVICNDLKIMRRDNRFSYLIARNCGGVLCCSRNGGAMKVNEFRVSTDTSNITCLEVSTHGLPYFLAATDTGTVNLCSLVHGRVLLTLDCRNHPSSQEGEKYLADQKGRFAGSVLRTTNTDDVSVKAQLSVRQVLWPSVNPCCIAARLTEGAVVVWQLAHSDIHAQYYGLNSAVDAATADNLLALVTPEGEAQLHTVGSVQNSKQHRDLFSKYAALL